MFTKELLKGVKLTLQKTLSPERMADLSVLPSKAERIEQIIDNSLLDDNGIPAGRRLLMA